MWVCSGFVRAQVEYSGLPLLMWLPKSTLHMRRVQTVQCYLFQVAHIASKSHKILWAMNYI